jgi:DNA modification methylase
MTALDVLAGKAQWAVEQGDVLERLAALPDESVNCVVCSPPYWGLRSYLPNGHADKAMEMGSEPTPDAYVARLVAVFREVRRVLRRDGTCWVNLGDSYANDTKWGGSSGGKYVAELHGPTGIGRGKRDTGLKPKDLCGIPWRVAFALQADGWYLRSDIVWAKPNPMPESVTDRPTTAHEYVFMLTKSARYAYDADAIREPAEYGRLQHFRSATYENDRSRDNSAQQTPVVKRGLADETAGRNKRTVWTIATEPYPDAHFATMPTALVEPCILAGAPGKTCPACGAPWARVVEETRRPLTPAETPGRGWLDAIEDQDLWASGTPTHSGLRRTTAPVTTTLGWAPTCTHGGLAPIGGVVLDPFVGSGTVVMEALRHGRRGIGFDLSPDYCAMARRRIEGDCPLFNTVAPDDLGAEAAG